MATRTDNGLCAWSHSRANTMMTCQRQFYFSYRAPARWNHPDPKMRDLFLLKQVKPIAMWKGDVVHQAIAEYFRALQSGRSLPETAVLQYAQQLAKAQWTFSVTGRYRTEGRNRAGSAFASLFEHEYQVEDAESFRSGLWTHSTMPHKFLPGRQNSSESRIPFVRGEITLLNPLLGEQAQPSYS